MTSTAVRCLSACVGTQYFAYKKKNKKTFRIKCCSAISETLAFGNYHPTLRAELVTFCVSVFYTVSTWQLANHSVDLTPSLP